MKHGEGRVRIYQPSHDERQSTLESKRSSNLPWPWGLMRAVIHAPSLCPFEAYISCTTGLWEDKPWDPGAQVKNYTDSIYKGLVGPPSLDSGI